MINRIALAVVYVSDQQKALAQPVEVYNPTSLFGDGAP
jgi:hypothetical protein